MKRRNWNTEQPASLKEAIELCVAYARYKRNLSVERIAELMGLSGHHTLYKWLANGRMPATLIRPFEHACGINYVSRYIAHSAQLLTIKIPSGKTSTARGHNTLQRSVNDAVSALIDFSEQKVEADECLAVVTQAMEDMAWHRANVEKAIQPEFQLFDGDES